ncbi:MAG: carbohydrate porin [Caldimonas sp.]
MRNRVFFATSCSSRWQGTRLPGKTCRTDRPSAFSAAGGAASALLLLVLALPVAADQADAPAPAASGGLTPSLTYDGTALANLSGGARTGRAYVGNLHLKLAAQDGAFGWPGFSAFADVLTIHGGQPGSLVGDAQGVSNLEGPPGTQVEELWLQYNWKRSNASLLAGIYDLNSEFYRLQAAGLFLNGAFGIGAEFAQSGVEGPSIFPRTSAGLRFAFKPTPDSVLRAAVLDGVPVVRPDGSHAVFRGGDGLLAVAEFALLSRDGARTDRQAPARDRVGRFSSLAPYDDKLALGAWRYTSRYPDLSDTDGAGNALMRRGSSGVYAVGERLLIGGDGALGKRLSAFAQAGIADARTNRFGGYFGAGLVGSGWGPFKDSDQIGLSIAHARNGSHYLRAQAAQGVNRAETTIELTYLTQVSKYLAVQPDLQRVIHPDTDPSIASAWVVQLRFELAF